MHPIRQQSINILHLKEFINEICYHYNMLLNCVCKFIPYRVFQCCVCGKVRRNGFRFAYISYLVLGCFLVEPVLYFGRRNKM
jgi:hypothetical protein